MGKSKRTMKKTILSVLALGAFALTAHAQSAAELGGAKFGTSYEETLHAVETAWGSPKAQSETSVTYANALFEGVKANRVELGFQQLSDVKKLNQARVYFDCPNKAAAMAKMKAVVKKLESLYAVSYDEEDGGTSFYKGGNSPLGIGNLFTVFVSPYQGKWTCQVRYGAFKYRN